MTALSGGIVKTDKVDRQKKGQSGGATVFVLVESIDEVCPPARLFFYIDQATLATESRCCCEC